MATPTLSTQNIDDLYTTTYEYRKTKVINQVYTSTPFWYMMTKNGKMEGVRGGKWIEQPLAYGKNTTVKFFGKGDTFAVKDENITTAAIYNWKYLGGSLVRYMVDEQRNAGDSMIKKWVNIKIDNLTSSLVDYAETSLFSDGTADDSKEFGGLKYLVPIAPATGTVGNIDRAVYDWWRNYYYNMGSDSTALYLRKKMVTAFNTCGKYGEQSEKNEGLGVLGKYPNLVITDQTSYELYEDELFELKIIQSATAGVGDLGFGNLLFKGVPLTWSVACPAGYMYFLNTNFLNWVYDPDYNFIMDDWKAIPNQAKDRVTQVLAAGNLTMSNARKQGILYGIGSTA